MRSTRSSRCTALALTLTLVVSIAAPAFASAIDKKTPVTSVQNEITLDAKGRSIKESIKNRDGRKEFSSAELEEMRAALLAMLSTTYYATPLLDKMQASGQTSDEYAEISNRIKLLTDAELTTFRAALNPVSIQQQLQTALDKINGVKSRSVFGTKTAGMPTADYYCKGQALMLGISSPVSPETLSASDDIYFIAEGVRDLAQNACNQVAVVVVLGEGGGANTRLLCNISDAVYLVAKVLNQKYHFCDDNEDSEDIGAIQGGITHLNTDIANGITSTATSITTSQTAITTNDNTNKTTIVNNDNANKTTIVNNDNSNKDTLLADSNTHYVALNNTINAALASIIGNANANKDEIKNLLLRTQIEADLSINDGQPFVALYQMPATSCFPSFDAAGVALTFPQQCGLLDLARSIVQQTIAKTGNNQNALKMFARAEGYRTMGRYSDAYKTYRSAYKEALK